MPLRPTILEIAMKREEVPKSGILYRRPQGIPVPLLAVYPSKIMNDNSRMDLPGTPLSRSQDAKPRIVPAMLNRW